MEDQTALKNTLIKFLGAITLDLGAYGISKITKTSKKKQKEFNQITTNEPLQKES